MTTEIDIRKDDIALEAARHTAHLMHAEETKEIGVVIRIEFARIDMLIRVDLARMGMKNIAVTIPETSQ